MSIVSNIIGLAVTAFVLLLPPLAWHSLSRNIPAVILIIWLLIMNLKTIIDASIWSGSDFMQRWNGKIWCDIMIKLQIGANIGISCAVTNIVYNLNAILKADSVLPQWNSWGKVCIDFSISLITPFCVMIFSYLLQNYRYGIARYNGCQNLLSPTWLTTVLYTVWMLIWSFIGTIYAVMVLHTLYKKRKDVRDILHCTNSGLNLTRFARLWIFCFLIILVMFPFSIYSFVQDLSNVQGSYSFKDSHSSATWQLIFKFDPGSPLYNIWLYMLMAYLVFIIFGLGSDALKMYSRFLYSIKLGFIVECIQSFIPKNADSRIHRLMGKLSNSKKYNSSGYSSDEKFDSDLCISNSSSPIDSSHIFVDDKIPFDSQRKEKIRRERRWSQLEEFDTSNEFISAFIPANMIDQMKEEISMDKLSAHQQSDSTIMDDDKTLYRTDNTQIFSSPSSSRTDRSESIPPCDSTSELDFYYKIESKK